ncbi:unnamed protein product [Cochlearia groenlandica]
MEPSSITTITEEEDIVRFLDRRVLLLSGMPSAARFRRRRLKPRRRIPICSDRETIPSFYSSSSSSSSSNDFEIREIPSYAVTSEELKLDFEASVEDSDVTESTKDLIGLTTEEEEDNDFDVISFSVDMEGSDSGQDRVDPVQEEAKTEESAVIDDRRDDYAVSNARDFSLLGIVLKAIRFQVDMMLSFVKFPPLLLKRCSLFGFDPFTVITLGRLCLTTRVLVMSDVILRKFNRERMVNLACKFGSGLFSAVYVGIVLFGLLFSALMLGGFVINRVADKPFVVNEVLNFDYTKNSPEAYVPITSCAGVSCDGSCKESNEMSRIRGSRAIPRDHKLEIALSMTLPESSYNKKLGMFQVRVDFLSADGQTLASIRRPCMLRFRSEPIRLVQTLFKVVPLVTGYASEIQTLTLKLKGFAEKDIPTACLKIMIEQRAEFRPGAGIPELYDATLSLKSDLPFFKKIIWRWRKTLFVWISMSLFITELLFVLVCCRPLIIPRTRR